MEERNDIVIYKSEDGLVKMEAMIDPVNETIWANQKAIAALFDVTVPNISYHFKKIFKSGELDAGTVVKDFLITAQSGARGTSDEKVKYYNLDAIISIGYRINSFRATKFRIWATQVLKQYMLKGFAINRNAASEQKYEDLKKAVGLLENVFSKELLLTSDQTTDLFDVIRDYTYALDTLDAYDYQSLKIADTTVPERFHATYENAIQAIQSLKEKFGGSNLFGVEKDESFHSSIGQRKEKTSTPALRRRPQCCYILSSRTTPSWTATNESQPRSSSGSCRTTASCIAPMDQSASPMPPSWP